MTQVAQLCAHLSRPGSGERTVTTGDITVELCKRCVQELYSRLVEMERPATPIEQYANKQEIGMEKGCIYETRKDLKVFCRAVCDEGQTMCPRHIAVTAAEVKAAAKREYDKEMRKQAAKVMGRTGSRIA